MDNDRVERAIQYAHDVGFDEGYEVGWDDGYAEGLMQCDQNQTLVVMAPSGDVAHEEMD